MPIAVVERMEQQKETTEKHVVETCIEYIMAGLTESDSDFEMDMTQDGETETARTAYSHFIRPSILILL